MISAGLDAGSRAIKIVLYDGETNTIIKSDLIDQGIHQSQLAEDLFNQTINDAGLSRDDVQAIVATGYGRDAIDFANKTITEITCHARGVFHLHPEARTIIDIGGQDSKVLHLEQNGKVRDFMMNDRCAAGTGRFLEVVSERMNVSLTNLGDMAAKATAPATISSMCVVFAETEIVSLLASGETPENIVAGVQASIASRVASMAGRHAKEPLIFTGGVAQVSGMKEAIFNSINLPVKVADMPQMTGALGAAILAQSIA